MNSFRVEEALEATAVSQDYDPRFRIYIHDSTSSATTGATAVFDVVGANFLQALDWAQTRTTGSQTYAIALARPAVNAPGWELTWILGCDGNDSETDIGETQIQQGMLLRRDHPVTIPTCDKAPFE